MDLGLILEGRIMKKVLKNKKGFTLVELVVVIAILAILALILIPSISGYVKNAEVAKDQANARSLWTAGMLVEQTFNGSDADAFETETLSVAGFSTDAVVEFDSNKKLISVQYGDQKFNGTEFTTQTAGQ